MIPLSDSFGTIKPVMFLANVDEKGFKNNLLLDDLNSYASSINCPVVNVCAKIESDISELEDEEKLLFLSELDLEVLQKFSGSIDQSVFKYLTLKGSVQSRNHFGGTSFTAVKSALKKAHQKLA